MVKILVKIILGGMPEPPFFTALSRFLIDNFESCHSDVVIAGIPGDRGPFLINDHAQMNGGYL